MKKKDIEQIAVSVVVCAVGAVTGLVMMVLSGKELDKKNKSGE